MEKDLIIKPRESVISLFEKKFIKGKKKDSTFTRFELAAFLRENIDFEEKLIKSIYKDSIIMNEHLSPSSYYDKMFGNTNLMLPDLNTAILATFTYKGSGQYETRKTITAIGTFQKLSERDKINYPEKADVVFKSRNHTTEYKDILKWNYIDEKMLFPFFDIIKSNKIIPINNKKLVKRFIAIYKQYVQLGIVKNYETNDHIYVGHNDGHLLITDLVEKISNKRLERDMVFTINVSGIIKAAWNLEMRKLIPRDNPNDVRELFGINFSKREQDKITIDSLLLTEEDVIALENRYKEITTNKEQKYFDFQDCEFEYKEIQRQIAREVDLNNMVISEFYSENKYFWLSQSYTYKHDISPTIVEKMFKNNETKISNLGIDKFLFHSEGKNDDGYNEFDIKKGNSVKVDSGYFFDHTDSYKKPKKHHLTYLRMVDDFENPLHNKIAGFLIEMYSGVKQESDDYYLSRYYMICKNPQNFEKDFMMDNVPVLKVGEKYFFYSDNICIQLGEGVNFFKFEELKQPITIMFDEIIKHNGKFTNMKLAVKFPMRNYMVKRNML